jgi:competence protein ComEC
VPALRGAGIGRLDLLVLSHEDSDHIGGALSVLEAMEVEALASSLGVGHPLRGMVAAPRACGAGESWTWDGVRFEFLNAVHHARRNDRSCVLRIATKDAAVLLTGDIERAGENALLSSGLKSDVLLVPHHGSRTSSTPQFVAAVAPRWAVIAAGYRNRFGHPHGEVLERYRAARAEVLRTDRDGAVSFLLAESGISVVSERSRRGRYWLQ